MNRDALRDALVVSWLAVASSVVLGTVSVVVGARSSSSALIGTGTDVLADMLSSVVLVWRFRSDLRGAQPSHQLERRAHLAASVALIVVAAGVTAGAVAHLAAGSGADPSAAAIAVAAVSLVLLPAFAVMKFRIAARAPSRALRTDGLITLVGAATAGLSLVGLVLTDAVHWTAADPVAALGVAALAAGTGVTELRHR